MLSSSEDGVIVPTDLLRLKHPFLRRVKSTQHRAVNAGTEGIGEIEFILSILIQIGQGHTGDAQAAETCSKGEDLILP